MSKLTEDRYKKLCSDYVPLGVWVFWSVAGLLGLGLLGSQFNGFGNALTFLISIVGALGATGAAFAAYLTVRELRNERQEERSNRRPYFSFVDGEMGKAVDDDAQYGESGYIRVKLRQVGTNPAYDLTVNASLLMDVDNGFANEEVISRAVNDIASGFDYDFNRGGLHIDITQHHYVVLELDYYDAVYRVRFPPQHFFLQWNGLDPYDATDTSAPLYTITREVKPLVLSMLRGT
jgi:hypothetical protein